MIDISITPEHLFALYKDIGSSYNANAVILSEEMSELNKELTKLYRLRTKVKYPDTVETVCGNALPRITEEMAHVYICMEALKNILEISDSDIQYYINLKEI